jgi:hypothetical protein
MGRTALSTSILKSFAPGFYVDEDPPGLDVRVRENGTRTFYVVWRETYGRSTRQMRRALRAGSHLTLRTARKEAESLSREIASNGGTFPVAEAVPETVGALFDAYRTAKAGSCRAPTIGNVESLYRKHIAPAFRARPVNRVTRKEVIAWARCLATVATRKRALSLFTQFFNWTIDCELFSGPNPCMRVGRVVGVTLPRTDLRGMSLEEFQS